MGVRWSMVSCTQENMSNETISASENRCYRCSGFLLEKDGRSIPLPLPFALPIPSLFRTSLTSPGPASLLRCCGRDRTGVSLIPSPCALEVCSRVDIDAAASRRFGFDRLLRPSKASRRSVTPTPRADRATLVREKFSICMNGDTLVNGERASPLRISRFGDGVSRART